MSFKETELYRSIRNSLRLEIMYAQYKGLTSIEYPIEEDCMTQLIDYVLSDVFSEYYDIELDKEKKAFIISWEPGQWLRKRSTTK